MTDKKNSDKRPIAIESDGSRPIEVEAPAFAFVGLNEVAYLRPVTSQGLDGYGIFAANGQQIGLAPDRESAFAATVQHDLIPLSVH